MIPAFLADRFDVDALDAEAATMVALDPSHAICWFNAAWTEFARANGDADIAVRFGHGSSYLAGISGACRGFYEAAFANALVTGDVFEQDYECSSPDVFRMFHLHAMPCDGEGLLLQHSLLVARPHDRVPSLLSEDAYVREDGVILQCSNCRRIRRADGAAWDWVPAWVRTAPLNTSHGLCSACSGFYWRVT